jgi:branched-chain amino acid transport system permease protein
VTAGVFVLLGSMAICAFGVIIEKPAYRPLRAVPRSRLITAIGVSLLLRWAARLRRQSKSSPRLFRHCFSSTAAWSSPAADLVFVAPSCCSAPAYRGQNAHRHGDALVLLTAASLVGVNNDRVISFTFALGSALAAAGGILCVQLSVDRPADGYPAGPKAFVAAVLGGSISLAPQWVDWCWGW